MKRLYQITAAILIPSLVVFVVLINPEKALAAVTADNSLSFLAGDAGSNTLSYQMGLGIGGILVVSTQSSFLTSITYAGVSLTFSTSTLTGYSLYYLLNPTPGTNNLVITRTNNITDVGYSSIASFTNAKQANPFTNHQHNSGTAPTLSNNYSTLINGSVALDIVSLGSSPGNPINTITATGANHVSGAYGYSGGGNQNGDGLGYTTTTTAGSNTIGYTWNGISAGWFMDYYEIPPFVLPPGNIQIQGANVIIRGGNTVWK